MGRRYRTAHKFTALRYEAGAPRSDSTPMKRTRRATLLAIGLAAALSPAAPAAAAPCPGQDETVATAGVDLMRRSTLCLINKVRRLHGMPPVRPNGALQRAAE